MPRLSKYALSQMSCVYPFATSLALVAFLFSESLCAAPFQLVTDETIKAQKELTEVLSLKNGIPVIYRQIPGSDILHVVVGFDFGIKDLPQGKKSQASQLFSTMAMAAKGFPKSRVFRLTEQYALELGCVSGIETSSCILGTINDYWNDSLPLFAAIVKEPTLAEADLQLTTSRLQAQVRQTFQDPGRYVNEVVNRVYYDENHPYYHPYDQNLLELDSYHRQELLNLHKSLLNARRMTITVVGSLDRDQLLSKLEQHFGDIEVADYKKPAVLPPKFDLKRTYSFEDRDIPTAYIRLKFDGVPINAANEDAVNLMINILAEELAEEVRTRQSLSYSVYSYMLQYSVGVGLISASTSKPQETITAITQVMKKLMQHRLTSAELAEYKTVYATHYFKTQETHSSLAFAISNSYYYRQNVDHLYEMPIRLAAISPESIQSAARDILRNVRIGVVYGRDQFKDEWAMKMIDAFQK